MKIIDLKPIHKRKLSFEKMLELNKQERNGITKYELVTPEINFDLDDDTSDDLDFGHILVHLKKAIYASDLRHGSK